MNVNSYQFYLLFFSYYLLLIYSIFIMLLSLYMYSIHLYYHLNLIHLSNLLFYPYISHNNQHSLYISHHFSLPHLKYINKSKESNPLSLNSKIIYHLDLTLYMSSQMMSIHMLILSNYIHSYNSLYSIQII